MRSAVRQRHGRLRAAAGEDAGQAPRLFPASHLRRRPQGSGRRASARRPTILRRSARCCARAPATISAATRTRRWRGGCSGACRCCRSTRCPTSSSACARSRSELDALLQDLLIGVTNFFRDPAGLRGAGTRSHPAALRGQGTGRHGPRLGARLLDRRGGLFDRHPAARAHAQGAERAQAADLRQRHRRAVAADRPARPLPVDHRQRMSRRPGWSATSYARTAPTALPATCARSACSPRTTCCATRRSPSST